jgi:serine/threonine protein kinase
MTAIPESLSAVLAGRYTVESVVGRGGMATVYRARDLKHGRAVAIKVLSSDLSATIGVSRFLREIEIAARLQHPHVLLLIDSGDASGLPYYVMPFVEGESLRGRLERLGRLTPADALGILNPVAGALDYAHRQGVVHRDIKPENILLSDNNVVVADFGVAKALSTAAERSLTRTGFPVGTVGYMSPEQAAGFADLDARSDVFSLGSVVYEMLIGEPPGRWLSEEAGRVLQFLDASAEHRRALDRLPGAVEQALAKSLRFRPEDRFASPLDLAAALNGALGEHGRFTEVSAREIMARAAEIEASAPTQSGALSLGGIQRIAAEVGIPPEHVAAAAKELSPSSSRSGLPYLDSLGAGGKEPGLSPLRSASPPRPNPVLGATTRLVVERVVDGEVPESEYPTLVDEARITLGNVGQTSTLGRSLAWRTVHPPNQVGRSVHLTVTPHSGKTRIRIEENLVPLAGGLFGGIMGGGGGISIPVGLGIGVGALHSPVVAAILIATSISGTFAAARAIFRHSNTKRKQEIEALADRMAHYIGEVLRDHRKYLR